MSTPFPSNTTGDITSTADFGTTTIPFDISGATTTDMGLTLTTSTWDPADAESFKTEWRKLRSEFLKILLSDNYFPIKHFSMKREMDMKTKETTVHLQISFIPDRDPKKGVRRTV